MISNYTANIQKQPWNKAEESRGQMPDYLSLCSLHGSAGPGSLKGGSRLLTSRYRQSSLNQIQKDIVSQTRPLDSHRRALTEIDLYLPSVALTTPLCDS